MTTYETDVVIVGAGASGLSAAKALKKRGLRFVVVEGSHRIGGRAYSEEIAPHVWFDLGCGYLHNGATNPFVAIADALGVPLNRAAADVLSHIRGVHNGSDLSGHDARLFAGYFEACDTAIAASVSRGEDRAMSELVDMENAFYAPYACTMAVMNNTDIDDTSAADYRASQGDDDAAHLDIPVPGGYGNLVRAWGADVDVSLNAAVEKIDWSGPDICVETIKGTVRARTVLVTVSTGILASNAIRFDPVLPDWKIDAYLGLPTGAVNKTCLHFSKDVFGPDGLGFCTTWNDAGDAACLEASVNANNTAIVFTGGRHSAWLEQQGQQASHDFAVDRVAEVFGNDIRTSVTNSIATAWAHEPWSLGSYSWARPGQAHQRHQLARPVEDRLFFAGEATIRGVNSTCHGAYLSGLRAADEIAASLGAD
ncbi:MAG: flavin monoamine oxidase family protein [Roseovarius sp.]